MSQLYADRVFLSMNGTEAQDVQSATLEQNRNSKAVRSMTRKPFNTGFVEGNRDIKITATIAVQNALASPKWDQYDYVANDVSMSFECGADLYVAHNLELVSCRLEGTGVGEEVKKVFEFLALSLTDAVGDSALFVTSITNQTL
jgi:hypothetical protein